MFEQLQQQLAAAHHERQVNDDVNRARAPCSDHVDRVVLRHPNGNKSNGRVDGQPPSNRSSEHRRSRLKAASATLDTEDLYNAGVLELRGNGEQRDRLFQSGDDQEQPMQTFLPRNGVEQPQETTC